MTAKKTHAPSPGQFPANYLLCGRTGWASAPGAPDSSDVTCLTCKRRLLNKERVEFHRALLIVSAACERAGISAQLQDNLQALSKSYMEKSDPSLLGRPSQ